jgi:hypothetical protein
MRALRAYFPIFLVTSLCVAATPSAALAQTLAVSREHTVESQDPKANQIRDQFVKVLQQYPPTLGTILRADPSLMNDQYLAQYPAVIAFLNQHPEIRRSPAFYLEQFRSGYEGYYYDARSRSWDNLMEMFGVFVMMLTVAGALGWLVRTAVDYRRWGRLAKVQAEAHTKLLDRFTGNEELLAYVQSPAGRKFLQSSPISLDGATRTMSAPLSRILWSMQAGVVLTAAGIGMNYVSRHIDPDKADPVFTFSVILISLGIGFIASSALSWVMSRRLGLLASTPAQAEE